MAADVLWGGPAEGEEGRPDGKQRDGGMDAALVFSDKRTQEGKMFTGCDWAASAWRKNITGSYWHTAGFCFFVFLLPV